MNLTYNGKKPVLKILFMIGLLLVVSIIAMLLGFATALEMYKVIVVILAAVVGLFLLTLSNSLLLSFLLIFSIFIVGQINYFIGFKQIVWLPYLFGLILYIKVYSSYVLDPLNQSKVVAPVAFFVLVLFLLVSVSAIINGVPMLQVILGSRDLIFLWSVFFLITYSAFSLAALNRVWKLIPLIIAFQIPLVIYQAFIIVPKRLIDTNFQGHTVWDSVVGGFGGDPFGGGASPALAFFIVVGIVYFTSLYRKLLITKGRYIFYLSLTVPSFVLAEIKVVLVLLPVALFFLFIDKVKQNYFRFILVACFVGTLLVALMAVYEYQKTGDLKKSFDTQNLYERSLANQIDPSHIGGEGEIGRVAVIAHWWSENGFDRPVKMLFGYGIGATSLTPMFIGEVQKKYLYLNIDRSVVAILLWELGLLGLLLFIFILLRASILAFKAMHSNLFNSEQKAVLQATYISLLLTLIMMLHSATTLYIPAVNLWVIFLVGYSVYSYRLVLQSSYIQNTKKGMAP